MMKLPALRWNGHKSRLNREAAGAAESAIRKGPSEGCPDCHGNTANRFRSASSSSTGFGCVAWAVPRMSHGPSALSRLHVRLAHQKTAGSAKRLPYQCKGATETRRRKRLRSARNSSLCKQCCCCAYRKAPECAQEFAPAPR
jgi:hypothetical protein